MYRHMLYLKEQQMLYYRHKCETFLQSADQMVSAKLMQRGSQLMYELDSTAREMRTLKDSIHVMERRMREEIRREYVKEIEENREEARRYREAFEEYKGKLNGQVKDEVAETFERLEKRVEVMKRRSKEQ